MVIATGGRVLDCCFSATLFMQLLHGKPLAGIVSEKFG